MVSASGSETSVSGLTPASAIIYDAYTSIKKKKKKKKKKIDQQQGIELKSRKALGSMPSAADVT